MPGRRVRCSVRTGPRRQGDGHEQVLVGVFDDGPPVVCREAFTHAQACSAYTERGTFPVDHGSDRRPGRTRTRKPWTPPAYRYFAAVAETMEDVSRPLSGMARALITLEPLGVVAALTPFNGALSPGSWKLDPALAAGNTVILKPPRAPASWVRLAELALAAGFPPGVIGGAVEGRRLGARAAERMKRYVCEAGGKSAIEGYADDALAKGARAATGGKRATVAAPAEAGFWYEPTVLADATPDLAVRQSPSSPNTAPRPNRSATDPHLPRRAASGITHHQEQDASHGIPRQHPDHLA
ncbi:aldehyde dehydrogenase family protein [Streptomyces anulatus]|uniref:aldehyde dehydrogenase family protein n=1 Tax=Streptomyces anulatus TaxID=1892 RepID=UPI003818740E